MLCTGIHYTEITSIFANDMYWYSDFAEQITPKIQSKQHALGHIAKVQSELYPMDTGLLQPEECPLGYNISTVRAISSWL